MKICFVGPASSAHIVKWCNWFCQRGHEVHVISFAQGMIENVQVHVVDIHVNARGSDFGKLKYLFTGKQIKAMIDEIQPDIVNAHFASSYGVAIALSGVKHYILSVWGSDIFDFPRKSLFHRRLLEYSLKKADMLFSTSQAMADEANKYTDKSFEITPFGVDMELFNPNKRTRSIEKPLTVGMMNTVSEIDEIKKAIESASIINTISSDIDVAVRIAGKRNVLEQLKNVASDFGIDNRSLFVENDSQVVVVKELENMDVLFDSFDKEKSAESSDGFYNRNAVEIAESLIEMYRDTKMREKANQANGLCSQSKVEDYNNENKIFTSIVLHPKKDYVIGTVKSLSSKYGIDYLLRAAAKIKNENRLPVKVRIAGNGPQGKEYQSLAASLGIEDITEWLGFISQEDAAIEWANMDLAVIPSVFESFGVAAVEAQSCGTMVTVSNIPGLMETTLNGKTAAVVERENEDDLANAIICSYYYPKEKILKSIAGRKNVQNHYEINHCFNRIEKLFLDFQKNSKC